MSTLENIEQLEDKIEKPGYLLLLVSVFLFLIIGFVNLIDHTSSNAVIFNKYSFSHTVIMIAYLAMLLGWGSLLFKPNNDSWLQRSVDWIQKRPFAGLALFAGFGLLINSIFSQENWLNFPALQAIIFFLIIIFGAILLFKNWGNSALPNWWRKLIVYPLGALLIVELVLQAFTFAGLAPSLTTATNSFIPFGRIYQAEEGLTNTVANSDGWYYPEFVLADDAHRIVVLGDRSVQGLQVESEENIGWLLNQTLAEEGKEIEVISLGYPDRGAGLYLDTILLDYAIEAYEPDEIIVLFDFNNDFQIVDRPQLGAVYYVEDENGVVDIHPNSFGVRHHFQHQVIRAYEGFQPNRFIQSQYLTPRIVAQLLNPPSVSAANQSSGTQNELGLENAFVFNDDTNETAMTIAQGLFKNANDHLVAQDVKLSIVTIPVFPTPFYAQNSGASWETAVGDYDLLLPEQQLEAFAAANNIPFLAMGHYMQASNVTVEEINGLYFKNDGQLTSAGHRYFANAVNDCFFAQTAVSGCSAR